MTSNFDSKKTLHEVIVDVLKKAGRPLTMTEIACGVNTLGTYSRNDGKAVPSSQIALRVKNYPQLFDIDNSVYPKVVLLKNANDQCNA